MDSSKKPARYKVTSPFFLTWTRMQAWQMAKAHPLLVVLTLGFVLVVPLEHLYSMVPRGGEPFDAGFVVTEALYQVLKRCPALNDFLAAVNTLLVAFQAVYIVGACMVMGRLRPTLATAFMYSGRGVLGWSTQLPVPRDFLGSEVDFPVGNASFFLFFSGHVGASIIAALDMRRMGRMRAAVAMDMVNVAQTVRLLATRGHYTIDLVSGAVAGWACYHLAGWYEQGLHESVKPAMVGYGGGDRRGDSNHSLERKDSLLDSH